MQEKIKMKDVEVAGKKYQISKMPARTASWIAVQILTKMLPGVMESKLQLANLPVNRSQLTESEFYSIQASCLAVCSRYERVGEVVAPQPVLMMDGSGRFALPDLEDDVVSVLGLTVHALIFNVSSFFEDGALTAILGARPDPKDPNQFNASK